MNICDGKFPKNISCFKEVCQERLSDEYIPNEIVFLEFKHFQPFLIHILLCCFHEQLRWWKQLCQDIHDLKNERDTNTTNWQETFLFRLEEYEEYLKQYVNFDIFKYIINFLPSVFDCPNIMDKSKLDCQIRLLIDSDRDDENDEEESSEKICVENIYRHYYMNSYESCNFEVVEMYPSYLSYISSDQDQHVCDYFYIAGLDDQAKECKYYINHCLDLKLSIVVKVAKMLCELQKVLRICKCSCSIDIDTAVQYSAVSNIVYITKLDSIMQYDNNHNDYFETQFKLWLKRFFFAKEEEEEQHQQQQKINNNRNISDKKAKDILETIDGSNDLCLSILYISIEEKSISMNVIYEFLKRLETQFIENKTKTNHKQNFQIFADLCTYLINFTEKRIISIDNDIQKIDNDEFIHNLNDKFQIFENEKNRYFINEFSINYKNNSTNISQGILDLLGHFTSHNVFYNIIGDNLEGLLISETKKSDNEYVLKVEGRITFMINLILALILENQKINLKRYPALKCFKNLTFLLGVLNGKENLAINDLKHIHSTDLDSFMFKAFLASKISTVVDEQIQRKIQQIADLKINITNILKNVENFGIFGFSLLNLSTHELMDLLFE
eukprot:TRINITY_DN1029_c0_g1_i1.p1 TRINITY_DN1029_c0_g1~~TRINITY_DN1029_c0_g1_i1.p1  ORF type:complete len:682 (-),score=196.01 TRINITY_DN1029_c0_g1_i1:68-1906(-)